MNINDYGHVPNTENLPGIPARITAVHKERYEIVCDRGMTHARLKTKEYFVDTQNYRSRGFVTSEPFGITAHESVGLPAPECLR